MDKALSIGSAILMAAIVLLAAWLLSGGFWPDSPPRSLENGLTMIGGPLGLWGGIVLVLAIGLSTYGLHELCNYWLGAVVVKRLKARGHPDDAVVARINAVPISRGLKKRLAALARRT